MNVDTAIQHMLFKTSDREIEDLAWCATKERDDTINRYQTAYNWTIAQCEEFLDNVCLAFELLVKECAA
jgi:hypothetical protein